MRLPLLTVVNTAVPSYFRKLRLVLEERIGIGLIDFLDSMLAAPFDNFTFSPAGASVYHLGNYGTAMTKLHSIPLKQ